MLDGTKKNSNIILKFNKDEKGICNWKLTKLVDIANGLMEERVSGGVGKTKEEAWYKVMKSAEKNNIVF